MGWKALFLVMASAGYITSCSSCTEQHDPRPDQKRFAEEAKIANAPQPTLTKEGTIPPKSDAVAGSGAAGASPGDQAYGMYCVACHGPNGDANIPAAAAMNPKPRDFTDPAWQSSVDDARIAKVIKEGGASVGLSPTMAPWGGVLNEEQVAALVEKVRSFKK